MISEHDMLCPGAPADWEGSQIIGVLTGTADQPAMAYLNKPQQVTRQWLELTHEFIPEDVFRFSAPCACGNCMQYDKVGGKCHLAESVVHRVSDVAEKLPVCAIRAECRWWQQEGLSACMRCPQVRTNHFKSQTESILTVEVVLR